MENDIYNPTLKEEEFDKNIRPSSLDEYVGQSEIKENLRVFIKACMMRDEVLDLFLEFIQDEDCSIFFSSHITSDIQKIADYVILIHQGKIIFEEQKDNLVYNYGVAKCGKEKFAQLSSDDYIIHRTTNMSVECLVRDKEAFKRKYKNIIVDNATLEDIMLFYVKGGTSCED